MVQAKFGLNITSTFYHLNNSFSDGLKVSSNWITSQQPKLTTRKKWEKKTARTPENIAQVRDSVRLTMSIMCLQSNGGPLGHVLRTAVELCKCSIRFTYVIFQNCLVPSFPFQFSFCNYVGCLMKYTSLNGFVFRHPVIMANFVEVSKSGCFTSSVSPFIKVRPATWGRKKEGDSPNSPVVDISCRGLFV